MFIQNISNKMRPLIVCIFCRVREFINDTKLCSVREVSRNSTGLDCFTEYRLPGGKADRIASHDKVSLCQLKRSKGRTSQVGIDTPFNEVELSGLDGLHPGSC